MFKIGDRCNWIGQPERLIYLGFRRYDGDRRAWYQFEKVDTPGTVWCEVLESDLASFEATDEPQDHSDVSAIPQGSNRE